MNRDVGRPLTVYGWQPVKHDNLLHEIRVTQAWLAITRGRKHTALRLADVDQDLRPDMELQIFEDDACDHYYVELDNGTVSHREQQKRWQRYRSVDQTKHELLVITTSEVRMKELILHAGAIHHLAIFTVLETLVQNPANNVWTDSSGEQHYV